MNFLRNFLLSSKSKMAIEQVGWIGLGSMGLGMAKNLQKHLAATSAPPLIYTNRTLARGEALEALGAKPVKTVAEVVKSSSIIFSCVSPRMQQPDDY